MTYSSATNLLIQKSGAKILIPARMGSKGLPGKNRKLFEYTANIIPKELHKITYVSTDDPIIKEMSIISCFNVHNRANEISQDKTSTKDVITEFIEKYDESEITITLYLTYPERTWEDVERAILEFKQSNCKSLLCSFECETSPYLMAYDLPNNKGKQVISHNLYRRQDYPKCFEISHFISIVDNKELSKLNNNLYNEETYFMKCKKKVDVDLPEHLERFNNEHKNNC